MAVCPRCGSDLDPDGTCAACLLAGGFVTEAEASGALIDAGEPAGPAETLEYDSFGPYRILRLLGEGGMGAVYLAEQTQPLQRLVALKVVKLGLSSVQILSRFNYERQALALMEHPNIARVYDAGASEKGRPFFVMEYVDGVPITEYCDRRRLTTRERLELFDPVCQALHHAHQKSVIHRDIKPSNVMVTEVDGKPVPKVIDFGIARATEQQMAATAAFTQLGQFIGTPEYMSPEQADLVTGDIDTSSDVYSLGVLLYELLVGAVPFDAETLRKAGLAELLRIIREEEAIPMTAKLTAMGDAARAVAGRRRTDPVTLRRMVSGDLNWIVMRAMEKDRRRRYPAASELAADLRRHLEDQPVLASPPSPLYRTRKFVRRHRFGAIAGAGVLAALVAGIVASTWLAAIARQERALAERRSAEAVAERKRAEAQTANAVRQEKLAEARLEDVHALADSMLFEINSDVKDLAGGTKAREALVRLGQQYLSKEDAHSETDPRRRQALAEAFMKLGDLEGAPGQSNLRDVTGARQSYSRSAAILESEAGSRPGDSNVRHLLTLVYVRQAQLEESASAASTMLDRAARSADLYLSKWPGARQGLRDSSEVLEAQGNFTAAVDLRQRILSTAPQDPVFRWELAHAQLALGTSLGPKNRFKALEWLNKGAASCAELSKQDPANIQYPRDRAVALGTMSRIELNLSRLVEAVADARDAVAILEQLTASDRRNASFRLDLSAARVSLSNAYYYSGHASEALQNAALAVTIQEEEAASNPDNPDFPRQAAANYRSGGNIKSMLKDLPGAVEQYRKAEAVDRKLLARYPGRFEFSAALRADLDSIAAIYLAFGDAPSALRAYRDAFQTAQSAASAQPTDESIADLAAAHEGLANGLGAMARWDEAIAEQTAAVAIRERQSAGKAGDHARERALARSDEGLSKLYEGRGDYRAALLFSGKPRRLLESTYRQLGDDESRTELLNLLSCQRTQYAGAADYKSALAAANEIVDIMRPTGCIARTRAYRDLGDTLLAAGRREESLQAFHDAAQVMEERPIEDEPSSLYRNELAGTFLYLISGFTAARQDAESAALLRRVMAVAEALVRDNPSNNLYRDTLLRTYRAAAAAFAEMGDSAASLDFEQRGLKLESASTFPGDCYQRGLRLARIASLELRLGRREAAQERWREALAMFRTAARGGAQQVAADARNNSAREIQRLAGAAASMTLEQLGDLPLARLRQ